MPHRPRPRRFTAWVGRLLLLAGLATLLGLVSPGLLAGTERAAAHCAVGDDADLALHGLRSQRFDSTALPNDTVIDARTARWSGREPYVVVVGGGSGTCLSGGTVQGTWSDRASWEVMHGTGALVLGGPRPVVEDVTVADYGDAIRFVDRAQGFEVRRIHLSDIRDDCIENDWLHSGTIRDSLLDGCYNAFSARTYDGQRGVPDGSRNRWTIEDSLVRLQPMRRTYRDDGAGPGTAGFFKWDPRGPELSLRGNVFRADQPAGTVGLGIPASRLVDCADNVMVWLGSGPYPDPLPPCFQVTTDVGVWDRAVSRWYQQHGSRPSP